MNKNTHIIAKAIYYIQRPSLRSELKILDYLRHREHSDKS